MVDKKFPEGAFREDGQPNIPSQAYADYLTDYYDANPMIPRADPVGYVAPAPKTPRDEPLSNFGFNVAGDYAKDAGQSFKNAVTGQGVATVLPKMRFYPGGPTGAEYVYGGIADAGLGAINALFAGLGAGAGFVAEQIPFQSESQEDRLSRDLLAGVEFAEQYAAPYLGLFSRLGRASKAATSANRLPSPDVSVVDTLPTDTPQFGALAAQQQQADMSLEELGARLRAQQPDELTDAEMDDAIADLIQEETDPEVLINNALLEREAAGTTFTPEDDQLLNDLELTDADFSEIDEANSAYDRRMNERIDIALDSRPEFQDPSVRLGVQTLRESGSSVDEIESYLAAIRRDKGPIYQISDAQYADQLRDLYARYNLPIPKTDAEERAADLIIQVATGEPINQSMRRGIDLDYLKEHATPYVFDQAKPTIQEALQDMPYESNMGVLGDMTGAFGNNNYIPTFSPSLRAAENLPQEKGSYKQLKAWMLKNGAKAKELEWSGADEAFEGRNNVTKAELVEYINDNKDLIQAETRTASGVMMGDLDGGDLRMRLESYIDDNLSNEVDFLVDYFKDNWEYNNDLASIEDYVASENTVALEMLIDEIDGIDTVEELIERFPDGYIGDKDPMTGFREVFEDADEASTHEVNLNASRFEEDARRSLEESLEEMRLYDTDAYNRNVLGIEDEVADPSDLQYSQHFPLGGTDTSETTYQFRDPTGQMSDDYFRESHFGDSGGDENLVAHARTAEFPVSEGGTAYHIGEIQSDLAQSMRSKKTESGTVPKLVPRTRAQENALIERNGLIDRIGGAVRNSEASLNQVIFDDTSLGIGNTAGRKYAPEKLQEYQTIMADFYSDLFGNVINPEDIDINHTFFVSAKGDMAKANDLLDQFADYVLTRNDVPQKYKMWADDQKNSVSIKVSNMGSKIENLRIEDIPENATTGAPFVESTDAWLNMVLKRQLSEAIEKGAEFITLPNPEMVKRYTYGDYEGHRKFYGDIAPKNLLEIAQSYDPDAKLVGRTIETTGGLEGVTALPLNKRLVDAIMKKGISTYAVPLAVGTGAGYGALDQVGGGNGQSGS